MTGENGPPLEGWQLPCRCSCKCATRDNWDKRRDCGCCPGSCAPCRTSECGRKETDH